MEMENPGEVSQILRGLTFDRNNIYLMQEKATYSPQNYMHVAFVRIRKFLYLLYLYQVFTVILKGLPGRF